MKEEDKEKRDMAALNKYLTKFVLTEGWHITVDP
jgi:hypothetical protein